MAETFEIVVTDVTIYGKLRCVAGWDLKRSVMIRPEPGPGQFWAAYYCGKNTTFHPGHVVKFKANKPTTSFPHQTEDWVAIGEPIKTASLSDEDFVGVLKSSLVVSAKKTFGSVLQKSGTNAYVLEGTKCGSLCGSTVERERLTLGRKSAGNWEKPRAKISLAKGELDLGITAKDLRQAFDRDGLKAIRERIDGSKLHLRLGLSRALDHSSGERRCYLQINGIYPI